MQLISPIKELVREKNNFTLTSQNCFQWELNKQKINIIQPLVDGH